MKLESIKNPCHEISIEAETVIVTVNTWANLQGATLVVNGNGKDLPLRMAGVFDWAEWDAIVMAIAAARAA